MGFVKNLELYLWNNCVQYCRIMANLDRLGYAIVWFCQFANDILSILYVPTTFYFKETPCFYQECNVDKFNPVTWSTNPLISQSFMASSSLGKSTKCLSFDKVFLPVRLKILQGFREISLHTIGLFSAGNLHKRFTRANIHPRN